MARVAACLLCLAAMLHHSSAQRVMVEVNFDLALNQESDNGYTATHTISDFLGDENLLWMRYFHTMASGVQGVLPMRVALMEFTGFQGWATFEQTHLESSHILYDLFWINWKRVIWTESTLAGHMTVDSKQRAPGSKAGYAYAFRYSVAPGKEAQYQQVMENHLPKLKAQLEGNPNFLERRDFNSGAFQSTYQYLSIYEFSSLTSLADGALSDKAFQAFLADLKPYLSAYASSVWVPSADPQGGLVFAGKGAELARE